jgi:putative ABC transport system permease protein
MSHAFLEAELKQLSAMVKVLPPIFLAVAAMLVNMTLSRLVTLEREQIGLLKAVGYSSGAVARHYLEFVLLVAVVGVVIGFGAGAWLGAGLARLYARFFAFPYLVFTRDPAVYGIAALVSLASAVVGALLTVRLVAILPPAVAMAPPAPAVYRRRFGGVGRVLALRQTGVMVVRHLFRWPIRTLGSVLGVSMAGAILVASLWTQGSLDWMIDVTFFRAERQDAILVFGAAAPPRAAFAVAAMPGVLAAEPFRAVPARISHRNLSRRVSIIGKPDRSEISRLLDPDLAPMPLPEDGLILSEALAEALGVRPGDLVTVETLVGPRVVATLPVSGLSVGYLGLGATMRLEGLNRLVGEGDRISGMNILLDQARREEFYAAAKAAPETATVTMSELTLNRFRDTIAENIAMMRSVYVALAAIIAGGVIYNFARISLSEQGRELASLRVLGFSRGEVASILFGELALIVILAQPLGWMAGYGMAWAMVNAFSSDLYRVPLVIGREVFATASLAVLVASGLTGWLIRGRIDRLNMIEVLKTRE